jgi:hypothetical protein
VADAWFQKEEYTTLRKEVESCMSELGTLEKACVGGVAAIFAWVAKDSGSYDGFAKLAWLVPSVIPLYGSLKAKAIATHLDILGGYLRKIELAQLPDDSKVEGWQKYFEGTSPGERTRAAKNAWLGFTILTILGSVVGFAKAIAS